MLRNMHNRNFWIFLLIDIWYLIDISEYFESEYFNSVKKEISKFKPKLMSIWIEYSSNAITVGLVRG